MGLEWFWFGLPWHGHGGWMMGTMDRGSWAMAEKHH